MNDQKLQVNIGFRNPFHSKMSVILKALDRTHLCTPFLGGLGTAYLILIAYLSGALLKMAKMGLADGISKSGAFEFRSTK